MILSKHIQACGELIGIAEGAGPGLRRQIAQPKDGPAKLLLTHILREPEIAHVQVVNLLLIAVDISKVPTCVHSLA